MLKLNGQTELSKILMLYEVNVKTENGMNRLNEIK